MELELFTAAWFSALLGIIIIDLVLAGDNAVVIAMAARNVPKERQKLVIFIGTFGAIAIRALATIIVVYLLKIPGLLLIGGILLVWISYKLLVDKKDHTQITAKASLWAAVKTIIIADAVMGLDNVLAVAGAAHGDMLLVVIGLLISIPIVVWGSTLILRLIDRYPVIIYIGAGVLAFTAAKMITVEPFSKALFAMPLVKWGFVVLVVICVLLLGKRKNDIDKQKQLSAQS